MRRALALALLALAGCSDDPSPQPRTGTDAGGSPAQRPPDDAQELEVVLGNRAEALEDGARKNYLATSQGAQRRRDRETLRNRGDLPLSEAGYRILRTDLRGPRAVLRVEAHYELHGIASRFSGTRRIVARRRAGRWRVSSEGGARDRFPWELAPYAARRTRHFLVLAPEGLDVSSLDASLERAHAEIRRRLPGNQPRRRYLVVVAADAAAARRLTAFIRGTDRLAAITDAKVRDDGPAERVTDVVALRLLVVWSNLAPLGAEQRLRVLTHELTHAVLVRATSGRVPAWLNEGLALYVSGDRRVGQAADLATGGGSRAQRRALTLTGLSDPDAIARLAGEGQTAGYAYASAAAYYIAARFGERRLLRLYNRFNDPDLPGRGGARTTDAATREVLQRPLAALERDLRRWVITRAVVSPLAP